MSHADAFAAARDAAAKLDVNPLWGHEKQTAEVRKDVGAILATLEAAIQPTPCPYLRGEVTQWCVLAEGVEVDYVKQPDEREYAE